MFLIDPYRFAVASTLLLDLYPSAAAAYSLRKLKTDVANVVRVRRSSDNTEADFTATEVADGTLTAWVGAGSTGYVRTWYDQSGNSANAQQTSTSVQPVIVSAGSLVLTSGKPSISLNGNQYMNLPQIALSNNTSVFCLAKADAFIDNSINCRWLHIFSSTFSLQLASDNNTGLMTMKNSAWQSGNDSTTYSGARTTNRELFNASFLSASNALRRNAVSQSATTSAAVGSAGTTGRIGVRADLASGTFVNGQFQEVVIYANNQSANAANIEANINGHYSVY